eukprot:1159504-Pelagomonas_calceolata.AAC.12
MEVFRTVAKHKTRPWDQIEGSMYTQEVARRTRGVPAHLHDSDGSISAQIHEPQMVVQQQAGHVDLSAGFILSHTPKPGFSAYLEGAYLEGCKQAGRGEVRRAHTDHTQSLLYPSPAYPNI